MYVHLMTIFVCVIPVYLIGILILKISLHISRGCYIERCAQSKHRNLYDNKK